VPEDLDRPVTTVVERCLGVAAGEDVVIVADAGTLALGQALRAAAARAGGDAVLCLMDERATDGTEPPPPVAAALSACDVFVAPTSRSLSHTMARKRASDAGARGATLPGVTAEMLARLMSVDAVALAARCAAVAAALDAGSEARLTCPHGSDLRLDLSGRHGISDDGDLTAPGAFGNLPCGEGFIAPAGGEGVMFATSLASIGLVGAEPARLEVRDGRLAGAAGAEGEELLRRLREHGADGTNLAELGVGTNDAATLTGNVLEDEKILGTVHVAFGASAAIGGTVSVPIHLDCVVLDASLSVDGQPLLTDGRLVAA
jgi:leucyl aminopeptidase (aminopeptidase T)